MPSIFSLDEISSARGSLIESAMGEEAGLVRPRFGRGCRCFAVMIDGSIAGYGWLSTRPEWIGELQLEIRPREAEGYIWNCVTLPEHRRKGVFRTLVVGISESARRTGIERLWIGSMAIPAEKALAPSGFRPAAHFSRRTFAGLYAMRGSFVDSTLGHDARLVLRYQGGVHFGAVTRRRH